MAAIPLLWRLWEPSPAADDSCASASFALSARMESAVLHAGGGSFEVVGLGWDGMGWDGMGWMGMVLPAEGLVG